MSTAPEFLVRFPAPPPTQGTVGVGFVVGAEHVLTCAHVVNAALGHELLRQDKPEPDEIVTLRLPMSGDAIREARVDAWLPPPRSGISGGDIAGLVILGSGCPPVCSPRASPRHRLVPRSGCSATQCTGPTAAG